MSSRDLAKLNGTEVTGPRHILCEGLSDAYFLRALIEDRGLPEYSFGWPTQETNKAAGVAGYFHYLNGFLPRSGTALVTRLLVVADNDDDHGAQFSLVQSQMVKAGLPDPVAPGEVKVSGARHVSVFMFPATGQPGCMESLVLQSWKPTESQRECVQAFEACTGVNGWPTSKRAKALLRNTPGVAGASSTRPILPR